jgi:LuxR family transcriptional regulator, regulator of acetate metabolism
MSALPDTGVGSALRRLRAGSSLASLFREATQALCENLGFERAAVFSLQGRSLTLESVHERSAPAAELEELADRVGEPPPLGPWLHESEVLRRQRAVLVEDAQSDQRAIGLLPGTRSFVAAPVVCHERPVGLIHADLGASDQVLTEYDRETVWAFAEGFGYALEGCVLAERLRQQSAQVVALVRSTEASVVEFSRPEIELGAPAARVAAPQVRATAPQVPARATHGLEDELTRRELEVLSMVAEGETNASIARRLIVSEDTVKTHVKHIFRKLGVHNRSQAVSHYFQASKLGEDAPFEEERSPLGSMRTRR